MDQLHFSWYSYRPCPLVMEDFTTTKHAHALAPCEHCSVLCLNRDGQDTSIAMPRTCAWSATLSLPAWLDSTAAVETRITSWLGHLRLQHKCIQRGCLTEGVCWRGGPHLLLSSYRRCLLVMGKDLGTSTPRLSQSWLKVVLSFSSAVSAASSVHARVPSLLRRKLMAYDCVRQGLLC